MGAYTLPVDTMVWLGSVIMIAAMLLGFVVSGALAAGPMAHMLIAEFACADADHDQATAGRTVAVAASAR